MYKLIKESDIAIDEILDVVLQNRGITDVEKFLEPSFDDVIHYSKLKNMNEATLLFSSIEPKEDAHIILVVDSDVDGNTSSAILVSYIEKLFPHIKITLIFHEGKTHGITATILNQIKETNDTSEVDLLIVADAGTSDYKAHKTIQREFGIPVLVLDHHEADKGESEDALVVNNQLSPEYPNKQLSGVGIVYKFLQALDDEYGYEEADEYLDLVALGNIADSMDLRSPETRYLVYEGLKNINNELLKVMVETYIGDFKRVYPQTLSFGVIPKMNGIIRIGTNEEKIDLFNAFRGVEQMSVNPRARTNKVETLAQKVTRLCTNAHKNQKDIRKLWIEKLNEVIENEKLYENAFILLKIDDSMTIYKGKKNVTFDRALGGVIAGSLASDYRKPVIMLIWDNELQRYSGSLRGYDGFMTNTKDFLESLNLFEYLGGHQNACGFKINPANFSLLNTTINTVLGDKSIGEQSYEVDFYVEERKLNRSLIEEVSSYEYLWGKGAKSPLFATEIELNTSYIKKSKSSNMVDWYHNGIKFVQFVGDRELLKLVDTDEVCKVKLVGSLSMNYFRDTVTPQFQIEGVQVGEVVKINESEGDSLDDILCWN